MNERSPGGFPPRSPEAQAAIERVRTANITVKKSSSSARPSSAAHSLDAPEHEETIRAIKRALALGGATYQEIADEFGVSEETVRQIKAGNTGTDLSSETPEEFDETHML